jgi:ubiquinone/menaquinone biosynthesis C-methylase UbiE
MWSLGDYAAVAPLLEPYAIKLSVACDIQPGMSVLDVAAGNGNFALAAAGRGADVTACDLTPPMIEMGRVRSEAAGAKIEWQEADAGELPFPDGRFDVVASVFGAMFSPEPQRVATEMFRVCRPGGVVAMANYGSDGFLSSYSDMLTRYSNPSPIPLPSPFEWGDMETVRQRFAGLAAHLEFQPSKVTMQFESIDKGIEFWERTNPPTIALRMMLPAERYSELVREATELMRSLNESTEGKLALASSYLSVIALK